MFAAALCRRMSPRALLALLLSKLVSAGLVLGSAHVVNLALIGRLAAPLRGLPAALGRLPAALEVVIEMVAIKMVAAADFNDDFNPDFNSTHRQRQIVRSHLGLQFADAVVQKVTAADKSDGDLNIFEFNIANSRYGNIKLN